MMSRIIDQPDSFDFESLLEKRPAAALPLKIVSGGQTGVDRAALDVAIELGIPHGGWCPKGRMAEDGVIPNQYLLDEISNADYAERTKRNVIDSDGTLILYWGILQGGTLVTARYATIHKRPCLKIRLSHPGRPNRLLEWIAAHQIRCLNVAGPRASKSPRIYGLAFDYLMKCLVP